MKRIILMLALVASATLSVCADNYNYLTIQKQDGSEQSFTALGLTITFSNGNLMATQNGETATLALSNLNKMFFSQEPTGIKVIENEPVSNPTQEGRVCVYDLQGRKIETGSQNLEALPKGVYIVNGKKVIVK